MAQEPRYLSQYSGTDAVGNQMVIVAEDMVTAATVYKAQQDADPVILQLTKKKVMCALPDIFVTFTAEAYDSTTAQVVTTCKVTPKTFTVLAGSKQIFTAEAADGYEFVKWQIDGVDAKNDEDEVITDAVAVLTIPKASRTCTIRAVFQLSA